MAPLLPWKAGGWNSVYPVCPRPEVPLAKLPLLPGGPGALLQGLSRKNVLDLAATGVYINWTTLSYSPSTTTDTILGSGRWNCTP